MSDFELFEKNSQTEAEKKRKVLKENAQADLKKVLSTIEGERVIWRIVQKTKFFDSSMTGNSATFYNEGMREVGRQILSDISELESPSVITKFVERAFKKEVD